MKGVYRIHNPGCPGNQKRLNVPVLPQPVGLRLEVPVNYIALVVLDAPGDDNDSIAFADPLPFFDLALDPAHPGDPVDALDADMVCPHHGW